ncbi:hypothetical protein [Palleronia marisminoris]|nr:hypothetical protein [Palleronia marisminoris]
MPTRAADAVLALPVVARTRRATTAPPKAVRLRDLYRPQMPLDPPKRHG